MPCTSSRYPCFLNPALDMFNRMECSEAPEQSVVLLCMPGKGHPLSCQAVDLHSHPQERYIVQTCHDVGEHPDAWRAPVIPRGDLQATFVFKGFDEVQRLGLTHTTEAAVRAASRASASSGI